MIVGLVLGVANGLRIWLMYGVFGGGQYPNVMDYVVVVSLALYPQHHPGQAGGRPAAAGGQKAGL